MNKGNAGGVNKKEHHSNPNYYNMPLNDIMAEMEGNPEFDSVFKLYDRVNTAKQTRVETAEQLRGLKDEFKKLKGNMKQTTIEQNKVQNKIMSSRPSN
mmetsp:Transcript_53397/g.61201  ORF Transcript_53397/g.61201 Transcript_53397/m.61201 type:complete len:98 (+) Transcript_53397:85-378(+)